MFLICSVSRIWSFCLLFWCSNIVFLIYISWEINNYGKYINQFPPNTIKSIRQYERINKKICWQKMSIMFNENCMRIYIYIYIQISLNVIYIYIYIYMCVCVCLCVRAVSATVLMCLEYASRECISNQPWLDQPAWLFMRIPSQHHSRNQQQLIVGFICV